MLFFYYYYFNLKISTKCSNPSNVFMTGNECLENGLEKLYRNSIVFELS